MAERGQGRLPSVLEAASAQAWPLLVSWPGLSGGGRLGVSDVRTLQSALYPIQVPRLGQPSLSRSMFPAVLFSC